MVWLSRKNDKDQKKLTNLIVWETHWFSHQFPKARENASKHIVWGEPGKLLLILFPYYECFFPIRFPSYGILHHMGNAWVFATIFYSTRKCNKTHRMERTRELSTHTFPILRVFFSNQFPFYGILHHMRNAWVFATISYSTRKFNKTHRMERTRELSTHTFPIV